MQRALCPILVGRDVELARLEDALLAAHRGEGSVAVLNGEAGIGKSRLSQDLERRARLAGMRVMRGGCSEAEFAVPYMPVVEALATLVTTADVKALKRELGSAVPELARLFPQLGTPRAAAPEDPSHGKLRLFESVLALLRLGASGEGLLLVAEDLQWADAATLEFFDYAQRRVTQERMFFLFTCRGEDVAGDQPLARLLAGWRRTGSADIIDLAPLRPADISAMVYSIFDGPRVGQAFIEFLQARTEGNPLAVEELLKVALDRGDIFRGARGWQRKTLSEFSLPRTITDLVLSRVGRLGKVERDVAQAAAIFGEVFPFQPLAQLVGQPETTVTDALRTLVQQQLMAETSQPGRYRFRHVLMRDAIYQDLLRPERVRLHARAAEVLRELPSVAPVDLANHLVEAGLWDQALPVCIKAAEDAERRLAYREAVVLYEWVLEKVSIPSMRAHLQCQFGNALYLEGDRQRASEALEDGVRRLEGEGAVRDAAHYRLVLGRCYWERSQPDRALAEYERVRVALEPLGASEDLALTYIRLSGLLDHDFHPVEALTMAERAVDVAQAAGADAMRIYAYGYVGLGLAGIGRVDEGINYLDRSFEEAMAAGLDWIATTAISNAIAIRLEHFRGREIPPLLEKLRALRGRRYAILGYFYEGLMLLAVGEPDASRQVCEEGIAEAEAAGATTFQGWIESNLAMALSALGQFAEAWTVLDRPHPRLEQQDAILRSYATMRVALDAGELARGLNEVDAVLKAIDWSRPLVAQEQQVLDKAVEILIAMGQEGEAEQLAGRMPREDAGLSNPYVTRINGRVDFARGRLEPARTQLTWVADFFTRAGYRDEEVRTRAILADVLAAQGDEAGAERERRLVAAQAPVPQTHVELGERLVTTMFVDVRGYTAMSLERPPEEMAERLGAFFGWTRQEIDRHHGIVDQFAGDAVMATFNVTQLRLEHAIDALQAALATRDRAAFAGLPVGIGIATGPAVVGEVVAGAKLMTVGETANLASRLEAQATAGEIVLSGETYRRTHEWLGQKRIAVAQERVSLKGIVEPATIYRLAAPRPAGMRS